MPTLGRPPAPPEPAKGGLCAAIAAARADGGLEFLQTIAARGGGSPIGDALGFRLVDVSQGRAAFEGAPTVTAINPSGAVHGGYAASMLESACLCALQTLLAPGQAYVLASLKLSHRRPLAKRPPPLRAEGRVIGSRGGQRIAWARLRDAEGALLATATAAFQIPTP